ncbi:CoB--CoM heterodisulfide reductase iron-sulfur subunit B family protein [bacterium]|nr:CoB--CoM heterodisulfide reductase iron-sulfur subunit B family protein [bacterium]
MKYNLFLGCTIPTRGRNYEMSVLAVSKKLGLEFSYIDEFACCGFPIKSLTYMGTILMAARNLALAEERGGDICTLCSACTAVLTECNHELKQNEKLRNEVNENLKLIGRRYNGSVNIKHFARILYEDIGPSELSKKITKKLTMFSFASHYGCHYLKPSGLYGNFDNAEEPNTLDRLIELTGARVVDYKNKMGCCGGAVLAADADIAYSIAREKIVNIKDAGADAINLVCPFCSVMYDANQREVGAKFGEEYNLPVLYYPQILGLAMDISPKELGFQMNIVKTKDLLAKISG